MQTAKTDQADLSSLGAQVICFVDFVMLQLIFSADFVVPGTVA